MTESKVRASLQLINPEPEGRGVYQWKTLMTKDNVLMKFQMSLGTLVSIIR